MHPLLQNKFVRFGLLGAGALVILFVVLFVATFLNNTVRYGSLGFSEETQIAPGVPMFTTNSVGREYALDADDGMMMEKMTSSYYAPDPMPIPSPSGYTTGLETYETTTYAVTGRTKEFDSFCSTLSELKRRDEVHVKYLTTETNYCHASLYVQAAHADEVLGVLTSFTDIEASRTTESVTRHKQQLESQTAILVQQLESVSRSLTLAETQFDELAAYARAANDATALSEAIRYKLQNVDTLTQRKINLTAQLNNLYQQAADLEERLGVVEFSVSVSRANPIIVGKYERQWEQAWQELRDSFTDTLIGITAFFGIFLLRAVQFLLYALIIIFLIRGLWKFAKLLWRKW